MDFNGNNKDDVKEVRSWLHARTTIDTFRVLLICVIASLMLVLSKASDLPDEVFAPLLTSSAMVMYIVAFSHICRRILFPSIDMRTLVNSIYNGSDQMAKAVLAASMCAVTIALFSAFIAMLR